MTPPLPRRCVAFTLLEMLLSLLVLAVLAMLLFASMRAVNERVGAAKCVSNLREIGRTSLLFFQENNGQLFPTVFWYQYRPFMEMLGIAPATYSSAFPENFRDTVLTCPSYKRKWPHHFPSLFNRCYSVNYFAHSHRPQDEQSSEMIPQSEWTQLFPGNLRQVRSPAEMWMFMDASAADTFPFTYSERGNIPYLSEPHQESHYAVFFDGHIEKVDKERMQQPHSSDFWGGQPGS